MIRLIQRRLIIPRGDTGSFTVPVIASKTASDVAVFTIMDTRTRGKIYEKIVTASNNVITIEFSHSDTVNLPLGKFVWDIKFYQEPVFADGKLINGTEVDSYYAAYSLPDCEIRLTGDNLLTSENAPTTTIEPSSLNALNAILSEVTRSKQEAESAKEAAENAKEAAQTAANQMASMTVEAVTLQPGSEAAATYNNETWHLTLGIPQGEQGDDYVLTPQDKTDIAVLAAQEIDLSPYAPKASPVFTGSISLGRKEDTTVGPNSIAIGNNVTASGYYSQASGNGTTAQGTDAHAEGLNTTAGALAAHAEGQATSAVAAAAHAEGYNTQAQGNYSHAEGSSTAAWGTAAHAEGINTNAHAAYSHAEGRNTTASGTSSHAEGEGTTAASENQHVSGRYNITDSNGTYAEIVGNGAIDTSGVLPVIRNSNARTLDWNGNEVLAGKITVGAGPTQDMDVATKYYVDNATSTIIEERGLPAGGLEGQIIKKVDSTDYNVVWANEQPGVVDYKTIENFYINDDIIRDAANNIPMGFTLELPLVQDGSGNPSLSNIRKFLPYQNFSIQVMQLDDEVSNSLSFTIPENMPFYGGTIYIGYDGIVKINYKYWVLTAEYATASTVNDYTNYSWRGYQLGAPLNTQTVSVAGFRGKNAGYSASSFSINNTSSGNNTYYTAPSGGQNFSYDSATARVPEDTESEDIQIVFELENTWANNLTYQLPQAIIPAKSYNTPFQLYVSLDNDVITSMEVTYAISPKYYTDTIVATRAAKNNVAYEETDLTADQAHPVGSVFIYEDKLYKATSNIDQGDIITPNVNCVETNIASVFVKNTDVVTSSAAGLMTAEEKTKLAGIASGATANTGTITGITMNGASKGTSGVVDLGTVITSHQDISGKLDNTLKGAANGLAELDASGKVPSSQLPSYVDDVLEYTAQSAFPETGETGKIYVDKTTNLTYRWSGTTYVAIGNSLALGETSSTAYRGDYGAAAYAHGVTNKGSAFSSGLYKITTNSEGHVTAATAVSKEDITALGISETDTTYVFDGTYNASTNKAATVATVTNAIAALDGNLNSTTPGAGKTLTAFSETDGVVSATFDNISITKSQVSDLGTIGAAAAKAVDSSISAGSESTNLPTSAAVASFVEGKGYTTNTGTITGITMNGSSKGTSGVVDLGTVITAHQTIPVTDVQVNSTSVVSNNVANVPIATSSVLGVVKLNGAVKGSSGDPGGLYIAEPSDKAIRQGTSQTYVAPISKQHLAAFYGLAKAAGDSTQAASTNAVGTYTADAKAAIQTMLGVAAASDVVTKNSIDNAGISARTYTSLLGGEFSATTASTSGYTNPYVRAAVTGRFDKHYRYRVTFNGTEYILPARLWYNVNGNRTVMKIYEYIGNLGLYLSSTTGVPGGTDNVPFILISDLNDSSSIDVITETAGTYTIKVEQINETLNPLPPSLIYKDSYVPIEKNNNTGSTYNGWSLGVNKIDNKRGTFAIGYANEIGSDFSQTYGTLNRIESGSANSALVGTDNQALGASSYAFGSGNSVTNGVTAGRMNTVTNAGYAYGYYNTVDNGFCLGSNLISKYQATVVGFNNVDISPITHTEWAANTAYAVGDIVHVTVNNTNFGTYKCNQAHTSASSFMSDFTKWTYITYLSDTAFLVGNGFSSSERKNGLKITMTGDGRFGGDVYANCNADSTGGVKLATINAVQELMDTKAPVIYKTVTDNSTASFTDAAGNMALKSALVTITGIQNDSTGVLTYPSSLDIVVSPTTTAAEGITYTVSLAADDTIYSGSFDAATGVLTVSQVVVDLGSLDWNANTTATSGKSKFSTSGIATRVKKNGAAACSDYSFISEISLNSNTDGIAINGSNGYVFVYDENYSGYTAEQFKTAMSGVKLAYTLTTNATYSLTPTAIRTLAGTNKVWCTDATASSISVTYPVDTKSYVDAATMGSDSSVVSDVQVNGTSIVSSGVANIPIASTSNLGVVKIRTNVGITANSSGEIYISKASSSQIKTATSTYVPIVASNQHEAVFYGLAKAAGDTTQASSDNAIGTYTATAKAAIQSMLGVEAGVVYVENVSGSTPSITGVANTRYICGEVSTISITPPQSGIIDVVFTSGTSAAVLTIPNTVKLPDWFDSTNLETSSIYEINIADGVYGTVMVWAS